MSAAPIWVTDEIETKPGQGRAFLDLYMARYVPGAEKRGMTLAHRMVEPAMWRDDAPNRLVFVWALPDPGAVWAAKHPARWDPDAARFWEEEAPPLIVSRRRATMADVDRLEGYDDV